MIGKIVTLKEFSPTDHFVILDKVLSDYASRNAVTMYLCQLKQKDGLGHLVLAFPQQIYIPKLPLEVVL